MNSSHVLTTPNPAQLPFVGGFSLPQRCARTNTRLFRLSRLLPALFLLLACIIPGLPTVWTANIRIGPFTLSGSLWSAASALGVASLSFHVRQGWVTFVSFLAMCAMILLGVVNSYLLNFDLSVTDIFLFAGVPIGAAWAFSTAGSEKRLFLWSLYIANWVVLAGTNLLLLQHKIHQSAPGPRLFVYPEFRCTWALSVLTPFIYFDRELWRGKKKTVAHALLLATILLMALTARVSITRSVVLQLAMCLVFVAVGLVKFKKLTFHWLLFALAGVAVLIVLSLAPLPGQNLTRSTSPKLSLEDRFSGDLEGDARVPELRHVLMEYGSDLFVGRGLGSGFHSVIVAVGGNSSPGGNVALAPHIAIVTLLMKGGILAFAIGILLPVFWSAKTIICTDDPELYASCAAVLMYVAFSCISGGWDFPDLFAYGFFLSQVVSLTITTRSPGRSFTGLPRRSASNYLGGQGRQAI